MTKDDFIFNLMRCGCLYKDGNTYYEENELIKCFEDVGALEQEPSGDLISRQAVLNEFYDVENLYERIKQLPSVNPQKPKTGHWIKRPHGFKCSKCLIVDSRTSIFCPSCGAKMIEPQESEEISERNMKMWEELFKADREPQESEE